MTGIYARQSVDKKDSISVETQIELCKSRCQKEDIKIYTDRGFSGRNLKRPAYIQMIKDMSEGIIDRVIVYRLDRLSRSVSDFSRMWEIFEQYHVFSPAMVDGIISKLRSYEDRTLRSEVHDNQEEMLKLVNKYFHCG